MPASVWFTVWFTGTGVTEVPEDIFKRCSMGTTCECSGKLYHCPLCAPERIKGMKRCKVKQHFITMHWKTRITNESKENINI